MQTLLKNWKTTSAGIITVAGAVVNLVFAVKHATDDQGTWMIAITQILTGLGLMFAGDASASAQSHLESQTQIAELQLRSNVVPDAIESQDTSLLRKVPITPAAVPPPVIPNDTKPTSSVPAPTTKVN